MDPREDWGQNEGSQGLKRGNTGEMGNGLPPEGSVTISFLCIVFSQEDGRPRVREAYR